jgi:transcription antitermination factor NusB
MQEIHRTRRRGRTLAVQALYQVEIAGASPRAAVRSAARLASQASEGEEPTEERGRRRGAAPTVSEEAAQLAASAEVEYADALTGFAWRERARVDALIAQACPNWRLSRLERLELQVLRVGVSELLRRDAVTPTPVVIDEAIELAREFGGDAAPAFVNGVLDAVARQLGSQPSPEAVGGSAARAAATEKSPLAEDSSSRRAADG